MTSITKLKTSTILDQSLDEAFPEVDPNFEPFGSLVLLQIKAAATKTKSGLILNDNTIETEADNTRVAKVISFGPLAFHERATQTPWPEGAWCHVGEFVRIGLYGGDRWRVCYDTVKIKDRDGKVLREQKLFAEFAAIEDLVLKGRVKDPLAALAFL